MVFFIIILKRGALYSNQLFQTYSFMMENKICEQHTNLGRLLCFTIAPDPKIQRTPCAGQTDDRMVAAAANLAGQVPGVHIATGRDPTSRLLLKGLFC